MASIISVALCTLFYIVSSSNAVDITGKVKINFYTTSVSTPTVYPIEDGYNVLQHANYNPSKKTVIYVHGWKENVLSNTQLTIANAYMQRGDFNVILLDWGALNTGDYTTVVVPIVPDVGEKLAVLLEQMYSRGLILPNLHLVGHSLGAHIVGIAGKNVQRSFKVPRIVGLDPALPSFYISITHNIQKGDGDFVMCLNTDSGIYGAVARDCDVNFLPNYGWRIQPGCPWAYVINTPEDFCSHQRSVYLWANAVKSQSIFVAKYCQYFQICDATQTTTMGPDTPNTITKGLYQFTTSSADPFGLGAQGI